MMELTFAPSLGSALLPFQPAHCTGWKLPLLCVLCGPRLDQESLHKYRELPSLSSFIKMSSLWLFPLWELLQVRNRVLPISMSAVLGA